MAYLSLQLHSLVHLLPLQLLPLPPPPPPLPFLRSGGRRTSLSLSFSLSCGQKQSASVCERACVREVDRDPRWNSTASPAQPSIPPRVPEEYTFTPTGTEAALTWSHVNPHLLGSDFGSPPWGEAPGTGSFEVRRDCGDLGYPTGKRRALGVVG